MRAFLKRYKYPILLSIVFLIAIRLFFQLPFDKPHYLEVLDDTTIPNIYEYRDMDHDGNHELIYLGYNWPDVKSMPFVRISRGVHHSADVIEQLNLSNKKWPNRLATFYGDHDHDGLEEFYTYSLDDTSLFLESFEYHPLADSLHFTVNRFICSANRYKGEPDIAAPQQYEMIDLNHDGFEELLFIVNGLYTAEPRGIYVYDIKHDSLWHTQTQSMHFRGFTTLKIKDQVFIGGHTGTVQNCNSPLPLYHDHSGWTTLFNSKLELAFPPVPNKAGYHYDVWSFPINHEGKVHTAAFFLTPRNSDDPVMIHVYDEKGRLIQEQSLFIPGRFFIRNLNDRNDSLLMVQQGSQILFRFNGDIILEHGFPAKLSDKAIRHLEFTISGRTYQLLQPYNEHVFHVYSYKSESPVASVDIPEKTGLFKISYGRFEDRNMLVISSINRTQFIEIILNPWHQYRSIFWAMILIALLVFFLLLQFVFNYQLKKQQALKEELIKGQLAISKKQLEPHFMLNMLNNIGALFAKENTRQGQYYFGKYASLLHRGLKYADQIETTLQEELDFIEDYLVLQKMRFDGDLEYTIDIEEGVFPELITIPHSLLYTFVENAIKHGLAPKEANRRLEIKVRTAGKHVEISIRDYGIGRQKAVELGTFGTGKGIKIVDKILESYNDFTNNQLGFNIHDNEDGTEVLISL